MEGMTQKRPHQRIKNKVHGKQDHDENRVLDLSDGKDRDGGDDRSYAEQSAVNHVRRPAPGFPMVGEITADQLADEPGEEDNERCRRRAA